MSSEHASGLPTGAPRGAARRLSPVGRYALVPALAVALLTLVLLALAYVQVTDTLGRRAMTTAEHRATLLAQRLHAELLAAQREVRLLARSPALAPSQPADRLRAELEALALRDDRYVWIGVLDAQGRVLAATRGWLEGRSIAARPVYEQGRRGSFVGDVHAAVALAELMQRDGGPSQEMIDIAEPLRDADGRLVGVLAAHLGVRWVQRLRDQALGSGLEGAALYLLSGPAARPVLADGGPPPVGLPAHLPTPAALQSQDGSRWFGASAALGAGSAEDAALLPWQVLALQSRSAALAPAWRTMGLLSAAGLAVAVAVGLAGLLLTRRLLKPWAPMFDAVLARSADAQDPRAVADAVAAVLATAPEGARALGFETALAQLAQGTRDLRRVVDHLPVGVAMIDRDFRVQYLNPTYTLLLGWTTEQVRGRLAAEFLFDAVDRAEFVRLFEKFGDLPGEVAARFDALRPDGARVAVQWHFVPMIERGQLTGAIATVTDIRPERAARARADAMAGRLRALADAATDLAFVTLDADGRVLEWSRGATRLTGHAAMGAQGQHLDSLLPPADTARTDTLADCMLAARRDGHCTLASERIVADGRRRWFDGALYALGLAPGAARFGLVLRDNTETREAAAALEASESRLRLALEAATLGTWDIDLQHPDRPVHWSAEYHHIFGLRPEELPADDAALDALVHPEDRTRLRQALRASVRDGTPLACEFRIRPPSGERWHAIAGRSVHGDDGRALRMIGIGMDVTARRQAEHALSESRAHLARIVDTMAEGLVVLDAEGCYTLANPAAARMVGVSAPEDIIGLRHSAVPWTRDRRNEQPFGAQDHAFVRLRAGGPPIHEERVAMRRVDGSTIIVLLNARQVPAADGGFGGVVMSFVDITRRVAAEQARTDSEARLAAIVAGASDAIVSTDAQGRVTLFNPAAERIFGVAATEMHGQGLDALLPDDERGRHAGHLAAFARSGVSQRAMGAGRVAARHASGRTLALEASISQSDVAGQVVLTAILRDVTERAVHEQALMAAQAELQALTAQLLAQEKETTRRVAQALHDELGQSLAALRLHWEALRALGPEANERAAVLHARIETLLVAANRQIRGVLSDLRPPMLDDFGLVAAIDNELTQQRPPSGTPQLELRVPPRLQHQRWPAEVEYAAFMIAREGLGNALYHADAQRVLVTIDGDDGELRMCVTDDGVGIEDAGRTGRPGHLGLVGMRERALAIQANLRVAAPPDGHGTQVCLHWTMP